MKQPREGEDHQNYRCYVQLKKGIIFHIQYQLFVELHQAYHNEGTKFRFSENNKYCYLPQLKRKVTISHVSTTK